MIKWFCQRWSLFVNFFPFFKVSLKSGFWDVRICRALRQSRKTCRLCQRTVHQPLPAARETLVRRGLSKTNSILEKNPLFEYIFSTLHSSEKTELLPNNKEYHRMDKDAQALYCAMKLNRIKLKAFSRTVRSMMKEFSDPN